MREKRADGDSSQRKAAYVDRLIDLFLGEGATRIEEAWIAGKAGDLKQVALAAHTLGCLAENVGARSIQDLAACAEDAAGRGQSGAARLPRILYELEIAFAETRAGLQRT